MVPLFAWIFFRAGSLSEAMQVIGQVVKCDFSGIAAQYLAIFNLSEVTCILNIIHMNWVLEKIPYLMIGIFFIMSFIIIMKFKNVNEEIKEFKGTIWKAVFSAVIMVWAILTFTGVGTFLYSGF